MIKILVTFSLAVVLSGCATRFVCPKQGGPAWWEFKSDHFTLRTDADPFNARAIVGELEYMRAALLAVLSQPGEVPGRLMVIALATRDEFSDFVGTDATAGSFAKYLEGGEGAIIIPADLEFSQRRVIAHELAHYYSFRIIGRQPKWFAEGLASYFETIGDPDNGGRLSAGRNQLHYWRMLGETPVRVREVLEWQRVTDREALYYAKSWLLFHYLVNTRPREFRGFKARLARNEEPRSAWNSAFPEWSLDVAGAAEKLDEELENYRLVADFNRRNLAAQPRFSIAIRHLGSGEVHALRIENRAKWDPEELEAEIGEALAEDPAHVAALTVMAGREPAKALSLARIAVKAHPEDPMAWRLLGDSLNAHTAPKEREEAFATALKLAPDRPQLILDLALALSTQGKFEEALPLYRRAVSLSPESLQAATFYAITLTNLGRCSEAGEAADRSINILQGEGGSGLQRMQLLENLNEIKDKCRGKN